MLTAVLAPAVRNYVQGAQQTAAQRDVQAIGAAISQMLADVGEAWVSADGNGGSATAPPSRATSNRADLLVSDGKTPTVHTARSGAGTDWDDAVDNDLVQKLEYYVTTNTPSNTAANAYRTAPNMSTTTQFDPDSGAQYNAEHAWRGPYLPGPIGADPWGNRYAVNVEYLARAPSPDPFTTPTGAVNDVVVLSAGNNGLVEIRYDTDGVTSGNDVFYVVSGGTR
jgi:type II secretory pathway pseudopilin PulG